MKKQISHKGTEIIYTVTGSGNTVVFLHGFLEDLTMWDSFATKLSASNKVVAIDLPGFGDSGMISTEHTMGLMADAVAAVIENENIQVCTMVGHSMGGYVTLAFADSYSDKLSGIVLFHSQAAADDDKTKENRNRTIKIVENNHVNFISSFIPSLFTDENAIIYSDKIQQITQRSLRTKNEGVIAALAGMRDRNNYLALLSELEIPVLFIAGKGDLRIPLGKIVEQIILPKVSLSLILERVGHMGFIEADEITYNAVAQFVENNK